MIIFKQQMTTVVVLRFLTTCTDVTGSYFVNLKSLIFQIDHDFYTNMEIVIRIMYSSTIKSMVNRELK